MKPTNSNTDTDWKEKIHEIIYEADTPAGKLFDLILLIVILASILLVMLESVESIDKKYHDLLDQAEWVITILFSLEYVARVVSVKKPTKYIFSFYGIIDFLSTIPKLPFTFCIKHTLFSGFTRLTSYACISNFKVNPLYWSLHQFCKGFKSQ